jgi:heat shock protein HslJ
MRQVCERSQPVQPQRRVWLRRDERARATCIEVLLSADHLIGSRIASAAPNLTRATLWRRARVRMTVLLHATGATFWLAGVLSGGATAGALPAGLDSPDYGVVCNRTHAICYDRYGPSIGLTESFLGRAAAERLTTDLRAHPPGTIFSPAADVRCARETGPCRLGGELHEALTSALYTPGPRASGQSAVARAVVGVEWRWIGTRYNDDTEARPTEPGRYTLRLEPDGSLRVRADCNDVGGTYRLELGRITIEFTHSTLAACGPDSLEGVFRRDLSAAAAYFLKHGQLHLDLQHDSGTAEFTR